MGGGRETGLCHLLLPPYVSQLSYFNGVILSHLISLQQNTEVLFHQKSNHKGDFTQIPDRFTTHMKYDFHY